MTRASKQPRLESATAEVTEWSSTLPAELSQNRLISLSYTTADPVEDHLGLTANGRFFIVEWDIPFRRYRWYPITEEYARKRLEETMRYRGEQMKSWPDFVSKWSNDNSVQWSRPTTKRQLELALGIGRKTLNNGY